jgi:predicted O-linked N-acetylglucosamine transferase (SPINDLY family)
MFDTNTDTNLSFQMNLKLNEAAKLLKTGEYEKAAEFYREIILTEPTFNLHIKLGDISLKLGDIKQAILSYSRAYLIDQNNASLNYKLARAHFEDFSFIAKDLAIHFFKKAIELDPKNAEYYLQFGLALKKIGKEADAIDCFRKALDLKPDMATARFAICMSQIPIIYENADEIINSRTNYRKEFEYLKETVKFDCPSTIKEMSKLIIFSLLCYQGFNHRGLQRMYGELVCRIQAARYPQWAQKPLMPAVEPGKPLRIGIVSAFFYSHANWKVIIKGWIENLNKDKFNLYCYHTGRTKDKATELARQNSFSFVENIFSVEKLAQIIRRDQLHLLIFPEIGLNNLSAKLASLRLAHIQCNSWGHPVTSGFPTIDYFLSSDLMESLFAQEHYTEKLIRLPNCSIFYTPSDVSESSFTRESYGLKPEATLFLCSQSLFKYLPQYDEVFLRIAQKVVDCQFIFFETVSSQAVKKFKKRLSQAFARYDMKAEDFIVFFPYSDFEKYHSIYRLSDVFLDSIGWSGCTTTLEAIDCNIPVVSLQENDLMRGRHSLAFLNMMGANDTIANTLEEYISLAVRLAKDIPWRNQIISNINCNKYKIYRDMKPIIALEEFMENVIKENIT